MANNTTTWTADEKRRLMELVEETDYSFAEIGRIIERQGETARRMYHKIRKGEVIVGNALDPSAKLLYRLELFHGKQARSNPNRWDDGVMIYD